MDGPHVRQAKYLEHKKRTPRAAGPSPQVPAATFDGANSLLLQRAVADPAWAIPAEIQALQGIYGNQAVQWLLGPRRVEGGGGLRFLALSGPASNRGLGRPRSLTLHPGGGGPTSVVMRTVRLKTGSLPTAAELGLTREEEGILRAWKASAEIHEFEDVDDLTREITAAFTHQLVSDVLGAPVNPPPTHWAVPGKEGRGGGLSGAVTPEQNAAAQEVLERLHDSVQQVMGLPTDNEETVEWVLYNAAIGVVAGVGVCDNYGALSAVLLRAFGLDNVALMAGHGHRYAAVEGRLVDPWSDRTYEVGKQAGGRPFALTGSPEVIWEGFMDAVAAVSPLWEEVVDGLGERQWGLYYERVMALAERGVGGALNRELLREEADRLRAERVERFRAMRAVQRVGARRGPAGRGGR